MLLLHGTFSTVAANFSAMIPALLSSGRCVYALNYGSGGIRAVAESAAQVAAFAGRIRTATGSDLLDVVGYSQGGLVLRTALRLDGIAAQVGTAVLIAPSFHGTTSPLAANVPASICPACADQAAGSALLRQLDQGGDLDGSVRYAVISTRADTVVTPVGSQVPSGPSDRVRSIVLQDQCPSQVTDHAQLPAVSGVIRWTIAALDDRGRPPSSALTC